MTRHRYLSFCLLLALGCTGDAAKLPDLKPESLTVSPSTVTQGNNTTVMVAFVLRNDGDTPAVSILYETKLTPVSDGGNPGSEISLGRRSLESLANKATSSQAFSAVIPPATPPGQYTLSVVVDPDNAIPEVLEDNNSLVAPMPITVLRRGSNVNFAVSAITLSASMGAPDDVLTVGYTLRNTGTDGILASSKTEFYLSTDNVKSADDRKLGEHTVGALGAGQMVTLSAMLSIPADMPAGSYHVLVVANADAAIVETEVNDNIASAAYAVGAAITEGIDIVVNAIAVTPNPIARGGAITVNFTLKNRGNMPTPSFFNRIYLTTSQTLNPAVDLALTNVNVSSIPAGATQSFERQLTIPNDRPPGIYYIAISADPTNVVQESNEDNNIRVDSTALIIAPPASADVAVSAVSLIGIAADGGASTPVTVGSSLTVGYTVKNNGPDPSGAFSVAIVLSANTTYETTDRTFKTVNIPTLMSGEMRTLTELFTIPADAGGTGHIGVVADAVGDQLTDAVRSNNAAFSAEIIAIRGADGGVATGPCVEDMYEPNDQRDAGARLTPGIYELGNCGNEDWFTIAVPHLGTVKVDMNILATPVVDLDMDLFGPTGTSAVSSAHGTSANESVIHTNNDGGGDYTVRIFYGGFAAAGQANYRLTVSVMTPPEGTDLLFPTLPTLSGRTTGGPSDAFTVGFTARNVGTIASTATTYEVRLIPATADGGAADGGSAADGGVPCTSAEVSVGSFPLAVIAPVTSLTISKELLIPSGLCPGSYAVQITLDQSNTVVETNETNNSATPTLRMTLLDQPVCLDQFEPNNSRATAAQIGPGTYTNLKACNTDDDFYAVTVAAGEQLQVTINFMGSGGDIDLQLQRADGSTITSSGGVGNSETITHTPTATLQAFIRVYNLSNTSNPYSMTVTGGSGIDLVVKDLTASPLRLGAGDDIEIKFNIENSLPLAAGATTAVVRLVPAAGGSATLLRTEEVPSLGVASPNGVRRAYDLKFPLPATLAAGRYDLAVMVDPDNTIREGSETNNTLILAGAITVVAVCAPDSLEPNDGIGDAVDATPIDAVTPTLLQSLSICPGDIDWFEVDVDAGATRNLTADLTFQQAQGDLDLTLFRRESSGSLTQLARSSGNIDNEHITQTLTAGRYFLRVQGFTGATNPNYSLNVALALPGM